MTQEELRFILEQKRWPVKVFDLLKSLLILIPALVLIALHMHDIYVIASVGGVAAFGLYKMYQGYFFIEYEAPFGKETNTEKLLYGFKQLDHTIENTYPDCITARSPSSMISSGSFITAVINEKYILLNARSILGIRFAKDKDTLDIIGSMARGEAHLNDPDEE